MTHFLIISSFFLLLFSQGNAIQVNGLSYLNTMKPGETAQVAITLISDKESPELVELNLSDYSSNYEGQHFFEDSSPSNRSNTSWIKLASHREVIAPGEKKDIYFTIKVPELADLNGSYWSVLLIEPQDPLQTLSSTDKGFQLQVKIRYAYHIVTNVGPEKPSIKILNKEIAEKEGKKHFIVDASNNGNLFLNPRMVVKLLNKDGQIALTMETPTERMYPESSNRFMANAEGLQPGPYQAFLLFDNGDGRILGDSFTLQAP